jgi:hypothetical protein
MTPKESSILQYDEYTAAKPIPRRLARAKDGNYYWLYYSGLGETNYHRLPDFEQDLVNTLLEEKVLSVTTTLRKLPTFDEKGNVHVIAFNLLAKKTTSC